MCVCAHGRAIGHGCVRVCARSRLCFNACSRMAHLHHLFSNAPQRSSLYDSFCSVSLGVLPRLQLYLLWPGELLMATCLQLFFGLIPAEVRGIYFFPFPG